MESRRLTHALLVVLATLFVLVPTAALGQYPPTTGDLELDRTVVAAGSEIKVSGDGFCAGATIQLRMVPKDGGPAIDLGTATADSSGEFSKTVTIPADTDPKRYVMEAEGPRDENGTCGASRALSAEFTVAAEQATPKTGTDAMPFLLAAFAAVIIGALMVMVARRRRQGATESDG